MADQRISHRNKAVQSTEHRTPDEAGEISSDDLAAAGSTYDRLIAGTFYEEEAEARKWLQQNCGVSRAD